MKYLTRLLRSGAITPQTYAEGLSALAEIPPTPVPHQWHEPPTPAPRQQCEPPTPAPHHRREPPTLAAHQRPTPASRDVLSPDTAGEDAYIEGILSQMPDERHIPAPGRRRPIPAPCQLVFRQLAGLLTASCEDGRWMCLKGTPMAQTPGLS